MGTTFRLSLPHSTTEQSHTDQAVTAALRTSRILFVDDAPLLGRAVTRMLRPHTVIWLETGQQALDLLATDTAFDLILSDVMMNPMTGWELLEHIEARHPEVLSRFAFLTGGAFTRTAQMEMDQAHVPVLQKPASLSDILSLMERLSDGQEPPSGARAHEETKAS